MIEYLHVLATEPVTWIIVAVTVGVVYAIEKLSERR